MNKKVMIAVGAIVVVLLVAVFMFGSINRAPDGGPGEISQDNLAADVPETGEQAGSNDGAATSQ